MAKMSKYRKYSLKKKAYKNNQKQTAHVPKILIQPGSVAMFLQFIIACHMFCTCHQRSQNVKFRTP